MVIDTNKFSNIIEDKDFIEFRLKKYSDLHYDFLFHKKFKELSIFICTKNPFTGKESEDTIYEGFCESEEELELIMKLLRLW